MSTKEANVAVQADYSASRDTGSNGLYSWSSIRAGRDRWTELLVEAAQAASTSTVHGRVVLAKPCRSGAMGCAADPEDGLPGSANVLPAYSSASPSTRGEQQRDPIPALAMRGTRTSLHIGRAGPSHPNEYGEVTCDIGLAALLNRFFECVAVQANAQTALTKL